jgi:hypothetical protein
MKFRYQPIRVQFGFAWRIENAVVVIRSEEQFWMPIFLSQKPHDRFYQFLKVGWKILVGR